MAVTLGKRKRRPDIEADNGESDADEVNTRALFQRAFEAKFKPLEAKPVKAPTPPPTEDAESDEDADSDWSGLSDAEDGVEVVDHGAALDMDDETAKLEMKAFMSSRPPATISRTIGGTKSVTEPADEDDKDASNLKHDLALQRLLKESHLLDSSAYTRSTTGPEGKGRIKALDIRLQGLGAKKAVSEQKNMPLAHRKGIIAKSSARDAVRRKEAVENGVILEKAKAGLQVQKRRERGVDAPSVGKFRSGTLRINKQDVRSIEGPKQRSGGKGRKR